MHGVSLFFSRIVVFNNSKTNKEAVTQFKELLRKYADAYKERQPFKESGVMVNTNQGGT